MAPTETLRELFKSERLLYRAVENSDEDKAFIRHILNDNTIQTLSTGRMKRPAQRESAEDLIKSIQSAMLGVVICLPQLSPPEAKSLETPTPEQPTHDSKSVPIGYLVIFNRDGPEFAHHRNAMISISLADGHRGQGYGGEAINWALDWAFQRAGLHRIVICAFAFNQNALKLYRKLGFVEEGREREAMYHFRAWHDIINLAMLEHEWEVLRGNIAKSDSE
ncbi:hypothetical protein N7475_005556 [Penicillium sp. IBT 31633x]|nr:hypothetical protein N7475_005556 [Penicillium sp. IBT 31633x]